MAGPVPPRLHVYLAREAPVGVILRRGPAKHCCTIGWNRETDEFQVGQWVKHRIYEDSADLSPDGRHFLFTGMQSGWTYTAISKAPYLTALVFTQSIGRAVYGGVFVSSDSYWMSYYAADMVQIQDDAPLRRLPYDRRPAYAEDRGARLERDGWQPVPADGEAGRARSGSIYERQSGTAWRLRRAGPLPPRTDVEATYWLHHSETGEHRPHTDWTWADWDRHRLVWTTAGQLWTGNVDEDGLRDERCLHDFNGMVFEPIVAPYEGYRSPWR